MRFHSRLVPILLILILCACEGLASEPRIVATIPPEPTGIDLAEGARLYAAHCASCHGDNGQGDGELVRSGQIAEPPPDFTNPATAREQSPADWFNTITNGRIEKLMPPWRNALTESERWAVALYTYTMSYQLTQGSALWTTHCAECHHANDLAPTTLHSFSDAALFNVLLDSTHNFDETLTEAERWAVIAHARTRFFENTNLIGQRIPIPATTLEAAPQNTGIVTGRVTNGTAGSAVPPDLTITLRIFDSQFNEETLTTTINTDGMFSFDRVPMRQDRLYAVTTSYQDRPFGSRLVAGDVSTLDLPITIYERTDDPAVLTISSFEMQMVGAPGSLQIAQIITVRNSSDRMFSLGEPVGDNRYTSITVPLPPGAQVLDANSQRYVLAADSSVLFDTQPVLPGADHTIHIIYALPYNVNTDIQIPLDYALDGSVQLLVQPDSLSVTSEQLTPQDPQTMDGTVFQSYGGTLELPAGGAVRFTVAGSMTGAVRSGVTPNLLAYGLIAVGGLSLLAAAIIYALGRRQPAQPVTDFIMEQIAALDDLHAQGKIEDIAYLEQRARLKDKLVLQQRNKK